MQSGVPTLHPATTCACWTSQDTAPVSQVDGPSAGWHMHQWTSLSFLSRSASPVSVGTGALLGSSGRRRACSGIGRTSSPATGPESPFSGRQEGGPSKTRSPSVGPLPVPTPLTCSPTGPGGPGKPLEPSSPFCPKRPCWPRGPGSPSAPCRGRVERGEAERQLEGQGLRGH